MRLEYFDMVDRVHSCDLDAGIIKASTTVPMQSPVFEGHFPGFPIMPGVLLLETMAQTSGYLLLAVTEGERMPFLAGVRSAKYRKFVPPGTVLEITANLIHNGSGFAITGAAIEADGDRICESELTLRLIAFESGEMARAIRGRIDRIGLPIKAKSEA